jgi:hypothetical protein
MHNLNATLLQLNFCDLEHGYGYNLARKMKEQFYPIDTIRRNASRMYKYFDPRYLWQLVFFNSNEVWF